EPGSSTARRSPPIFPWDLRERSGWEVASDPSQRPPFAFEGPTWGTVEATLKDTMIHEATHQAAFNTGLHSRIGESPKWVVEGLATVYEAPGIRNSGSANVKSRINRERFLWFSDYSKSRRKAKSLESFLTGDDLFK